MYLGVRPARGAEYQVQLVITNRQDATQAIANDFPVNADAGNNAAHDELIVGSHRRRRRREPTSQGFVMALRIRVSPSSTTGRNGRGLCRPAFLARASRTSGLPGLHG
jgi:hypothetical protein